MYKREVYPNLVSVWFTTGRTGEWDMSFVQITSTNIYELHDVEPSLTAGFLHQVVSLGDSKNRPSTLPAALARESKCYLIHLPMGLILKSVT